jgi:hypothetical protein
MFPSILFACTFGTRVMPRDTKLFELSMLLAIDPIVNNLAGAMLFVLLLAIPLAFLVSIALLRLYRRAVLRSMLTRSTPVQPQKTETPSVPPSSQERTVPPLNISMLDSDSNIRDGTSTDDLYSSLHHAPWRSAAIYSLAGLGFSIVMTFAYFVSSKMSFTPLQFVTLLLIFSWPIVSTINIVIAATWHMRLAIVLGYFVLLVTLVIVIVVGHPEYSFLQFGQAWFFINFLAILFLAVFLNRRIRAVSPLVLIVMILGLAGAIFTVQFVANNPERFSIIFDINGALGLGGFVIVEVITIGFIVFGIVGWLVLRWVGNQYKKKRISEQSMTIGALWLVYGIVQSIELMSENPAWFFSGILAFTVFVTIAWAGFKIFPFWQPTNRRYPSLLMLRVFSLGKRSERLFDVIGTYWRYIGNIRLIAGPDLLNTTIEPHEFLDFLSGKLARRFIADSKTLDLRFAEMDLEKDRDGRFRVNDFFCHDDTWRAALTRLVGVSDVVLMDLRGFTPHNAGCIFEISALIDSMPLQNVVFIIDDTTDESFLRQTAQRAWDSMKTTSPNRSPRSGLLRILRLKRFRDRDLQEILRALTLAVDAVPDGQH